jgi:hypothetical protein
VTLIDHIAGEDVTVLPWRALEERVADAELPNLHKSSK